MKFYIDKRVAFGVICILIPFFDSLLLSYTFVGQSTSYYYFLSGLSLTSLTLVLYLMYNINKTLRRRKETEAKLTSSYSEVADLYDNAPCGYLSIDPMRNITRINKTLLSWVGYTEDEVIGKFKFEQFLVPDTRDKYLEGYNDVFQKYRAKGSMTDREFCFQRKDGSVFEVTLSSIAVFSDDGRYVEARSTAVDSTERKKAEQKILNLNQNLEATVLARTHKLAESEKIYRTLASSIPGSAITLLDRDERYMLAEGEMLKRMGYDKDTMPGRKLSEVISAENYEFYGPLMQTAFGGKVIVMEKRTLSGFDMLMTVVPLKNEAEEIFAVMFVYINITDIKKTEQELIRLNETLESKVQARTLQLNELNQELESFTYSVSHDLRTPLRAISGYAQMLQEDYGSVLDFEGVRITELVVSNAVRMGKLIDDLLEFSRLGRKSLALATVDMEELVTEVIGELGADQHPEKIIINISDLKNVDGDRSMLKQVWVNLISNAVKYSSKKDVAVIDITSVRRDKTIVYAVKDNGAGFDMTYADKLFNVFQRLHKARDFEGTGVGLALVKTILKKHGGTIGAEATPDKGATFFFALPENQ